MNLANEMPSEAGGVRITEKITPEELLLTEGDPDEFLQLTNHSDAHTVSILLNLARLGGHASWYFNQAEAEAVIAWLNAAMQFREALPNDKRLVDPADLFIAALPSSYDDALARADVKRLTRELDVLLNGEDGAARQASLCDLVAQVQAEAPRERIDYLEKMLDDLGVERCTDCGQMLRTERRGSLHYCERCYPR